MGCCQSTPRTEKTGFDSIKGDETEKKKPRNNYDPDPTKKRQDTMSSPVPQEDHASSGIWITEIYELHFIPSGL